MNVIIITACMAIALGSIVLLLLSVEGSKGITKDKYTTKDGVSHTAKRERGDYIV